jgi:glycogen operon protein
VNYAASHDGYTLADVVSYIEKHNQANREDNRDGHGDNFSANWGIEGPTDDPQINETRTRVQRALLATVMFSHGTPMLLSGDEFGRTQQGNNNAYCQDNEISWLDWKKAETPEAKGLAAYVARLAQLRHENPVLRSRHFLHGKDEPAPGILDIAWFDTHGEIISSESWNNPEKRLFALRRASRNEDGTVLILTLLLNPSGEDRNFRLPTQNVPTRLLIDSAAPDKPESDIVGEEITVAARSAVLTKSVLQNGAS